MEKEQREPRRERVDGHDEQDPHYPPLLRRMRVKPQVLVYLQSHQSYYFNITLLLNLLFIGIVETQHISSTTIQQSIADQIQSVLVFIGNYLNHKSC